MKFELMLGVLFELLSKKCVKAQYLADKFEVSVRSIHRYINCLEMAGVPIYTLRGNNGGFAIVDTYKFSSTFMLIFSPFFESFLTVPRIRNIQKRNTEMRPVMSPHCTNTVLWYALLQIVFLISQFSLFLFQKVR